MTPQIILNLDLMRPYRSTGTSLKSYIEILDKLKEKYDWIYKFRYQEHVFDERISFGQQSIGINH